MRHRFAQRLRTWADRIDHEGAPKCTGFGFTIEQGRGLVVNQDGFGCPIWYYGDAQYDKAFDRRFDPTKAPPVKPYISNY